MNQDRIIKVVNEDGKEVEMYVLFVTKLEEFNKNYIFYTDPKDENGQVFVSSFNDEKQLFPIESEKEWEKLEEVFNQFIEETSKQTNKCKNCNEECDCTDDCQCDGSCSK